MMKKEHAGKLMGARKLKIRNEDHIQDPNPNLIINQIKKHCKQLNSTLEGRELIDLDGNNRETTGVEQNENVTL